MAKARVGDAEGDPRLVLVSRNDPLTPHLHSALRDRFTVAAEANVDLRGWRRAAIAAVTFRPTRSSWGDRYMKSNVGFAARSRLAARAVDAAPGGYDAVIQTHALFASRRPATMIYVDCTYRQAAEGWPAWTPHRGRARARWLAAEERAFRAARHLFAFTDLTQASLVDDYGIPSERVTVVGAGVNFDRLPPLTPPPPPAAPTVLFVGKDFERKGGAVLLAAFDRVRRAIPSARLLIVGTGLPVPAPAGVEILGRIDNREQMDSLYGQASVFCLPSLFDPGPLVVLEAMAHNLPCVLSQDASHHVRHVIGDRQAGWVAATGDADGLAEGVIAVLQDRELGTRMGLAAGAAVRTQFLWPQVVERMAPAIESTPALSILDSARR